MSQEEVSTLTESSSSQSPSITSETGVTDQSSNVICCRVEEGAGPANYLQRAVVVDNKVFIYGGENSNGFWTNSLSIIDGESNKCVSWKKPRCFDFPPKTDGHSLAVFQKNLIIFGGTDNQWINGGNTCIYSLDLEKLEWTVLPENENQDVDQIPQGRKQHSTVTLEGKMYIFGGISSQVASDKVFNDIFVFDYETRVWTKVGTIGDSPSPRSGHTMVYNPKSESLIVMGGRVGTSYSNEVWSLSLKSLNWTLVKTAGNVPSGREHHCAVVWNDSMIIYGGWNIGGPMNDLYSLDMNTFEWKKFSHSGESERALKRFGHAGACVDGTVLIFGGKNHLFNNQQDVLTFKLDSLSEDPIKVDKPKEMKDIEEIILDLDEKSLSEEMFNKPNFDPKDVVLYKNIFDQLTEENIKQYEELNTMLLKQKLFSLQVESLIETNKTLMAKEFTNPPAYSEGSVPIIYSEVVETPQSYKELIGQVFQPQDHIDNSESGATVEEQTVEEEQKEPPKLPESILIVEEPSQQENKEESPVESTPVVPEYPEVLEDSQIKAETEKFPESSNSKTEQTIPEKTVQESIKIDTQIKEEDTIESKKETESNEDKKQVQQEPKVIQEETSVNTNQEILNGIDPSEKEKQ